jgi:hypothetical protein
VLESLATCAEPFAKRDAAQRTIQELQRQHAPPSEIEAAKKDYEESKSAAKRCLDNVMLSSLIPILESDIRLELEPRSLHIHLMKCAIISQQGPANMAAFCDTHGSRYAEELLAKDDIMEDILVNGGAKNGKYLEAYKLYVELLALVEDDDPQFLDCHRRLAMGTALELVVPLAVFDTTDVFIDPQQRFLHYVNAHKNGELDPTFPYFSAWEYRHIVNSDAEDEELQWGRDHLKRYHPDMLSSRVAKFTYCKEVKTDLGYRTPEDWGGGRRTYRILLSGGGKCGPRAWMGRFILKSFGMPTFGCRQPGHAALVRYVPEKGWITCFGGGIEISWWENRDALDFQYEAHARLFEKDPSLYFQKVTLLECMATAYKEPPVGQDCHFQGPPMFWNALVRARRQDWFRRANADKESYRRTPPNGEPRESCAISTYLSRKDQPTDDNQIEVRNDGIRIPSCAFTAKKNISCTRCFTGGGQVHFEPDNPGSIAYKMPANVPKKKYELSLTICTVHKAHETESFSVSVNGTEIGQIASLYTVGEWLETTSVTIDIGPGDELKLTRQTGGNRIWGVSMRELTLKSLVD